MSCEIFFFLCGCFAALAALERLLPRVGPHVVLQVTRSEATYNHTTGTILNQAPHCESK